MSLRACPRWEDVSAAADGELPEPERSRALDHARRCVSCGPILAATSVGPEPIAVASATAVEASVNRPAGIDPECLSPRERRWLRARWTRWLLALAAIVIVVEAIPTYATGHGLDAHTHAARHLATWQIGFGVGLLVAAAMSRLTHAMLALAATFGALTIAATVIDIINGHRGPWAEPVHLVELVAIILLWQLTPPDLLPWHRRRTDRSAATEQPSPRSPRLHAVPSDEPDGSDDDR
ncbi:MAG: hypothetical protein ACE367_04960 [Acidimicrobiales bacterium]